MTSVLRKIRSKVFQLFGKDTKPFFTADIFKERKFVIDKYTYGAPNVLFENGAANLFIGKFCSIAESVTIFLGGNHRTDWITTYPFNSLPKYFPEGNAIKGHPATKGDVVIKNDVWIGRKVTILSGVTIGNGAVIAAESVVTKNIGAYEIWGGNPAVFIKKRFDEKTIMKLEETAWWDWDIKKIKENLNTLCSNDLNFIERVHDKKN